MFIAHEIGAVGLGLYLRSRQPVVLTVSLWQHFCQRWAVIAFCVAGSGFPDLPRGIQMLLNGSRGIGLEEVMSPFTQMTTDILHNLFLWLLVFPALWLVSRLMASGANAMALFCSKAFALGVVIFHIPFDVISHGRGQNFHGSNYFAPIPRGWTAKLGMFDYRPPDQRLALKPEELWLCLVFVALNVIVWLAVRAKKKQSATLQVSCAK